MHYEEGQDLLLVLLSTAPTSLCTMVALEQFAPRAPIVIGFPHVGLDYKHQA